MVILNAMIFIKFNIPNRYSLIVWESTLVIFIKMIIRWWQMWNNHLSGPSTTSRVGSQGGKKRKSNTKRKKQKKYTMRRKKRGAK